MLVTRQGYELATDEYGEVVLPKVGDIIYRHPSHVLDPFGGIGGLAFHAALFGLDWTGVELEQRFVDLGNQNLELWRSKYAPHWPRYGTARLLQGDSRRLVDVVTGAGAVMSSPPYEEQIVRKRDLGKPGHTQGATQGGHCFDTYGSTPGNLGNMPAGVVSSPPYAASVNQGDGANDADTRLTRKADAGVDVSQAVNRGGPNSVLNKPQAYGTTPGQLGAMPAGVVSSPPFEESIGNDKRVGKAATYTGHRTDEYAPTDGNIGNNTGDTFWSAAALIVQQCYAILRPGGYAAWITGDFVRNKRRVPFGQQWLDLCVACGFEPVLWAVAWKTEHNGTQHGMFGEAREMRKEKVSFFRRLANAKRPETAIANEDVLFVRKPL